MDRQTAGPISNNRHQGKHFPKRRAQESEIARKGAGSKKKTRRGKTRKKNVNKVPGRRVGAAKE